MNNYEELKKIMVSLKKPTTEVEMLICKHIEDKFEKAFQETRLKYPDISTMYKLPPETIFQEYVNQEKEYNQIKSDFYKMLSGVEDDNETE